MAQLPAPSLLCLWLPLLLTSAVTGHNSAANLDILVLGKVLHKLDTTVIIHAGANLKLDCISQGSTPSSLAWFETHTEQEAPPKQSPYAASSELTLAAVRTADSGRRFTCRSEGGPQERVVQILVYGDEATDIKNEGISELALRIILIIVCAIGMIFVLVVAVGIVRFVEVYIKTRRAKQQASSSHHCKNTHLSASKGIKCDSKDPSLSYTLI